MAERLTAEEKAEVKNFVLDLYKRSNERSYAAFSRAARVSEYSLTEWRSGRGTPSALNLIRMIQAVGLAEPSADRLEELRGLVVRQGKATQKALRGLEATVAEIHAQLEPPAQAANGG